MDKTKAVVWIPLATLLVAFPFQYGAIGRKALKSFNLEYHVFQFQYGAIGGASWIFCSPHLLNFNSSMVRLVAHTEANFLSCILFQFQYGAIGGQR